MTTAKTTLSDVSTGDISLSETARSETARSKGHRRASIIRLIGPGGLGELVKPFVFLDYFASEFSANFPFVVHPQQIRRLATIPIVQTGRAR